MTLSAFNTSNPTQTSRLMRIAILAVILAAFALRSHHLDAQSFWSDEGISLSRARLPIGDMLAGMPTEHTPGYFVALHGWISLSGEHDFGLRFFSLLPSVLAVALTARLVMDLGRAFGAQQRATIALFAALLMATNQFQLWYAQETRMYTWLLAAGMSATWLLWRMLFDVDRGAAQARPMPPWPAAIGYTLSVTACVYLHYYGFLVPIAHVVFVLGWLLITRSWRSALPWVAAGVASFLLFAPWLPRALRLFDFQGWRQPDDPMQLPWRYLATYTVGDAMPAPWRDWLPWLYLALALVGLILWWRRSPAGAGLLLASALIPFAIVFALALRSPDFHERYSIVISAPLLILAAAGLQALNVTTWRSATAPTWRRLLAAMPMLAAAVALVAANGVALQRQNSDATLAKPDFRGAVQRMIDEGRPGDIILVDGPDPSLVIMHYYTGELPVHDLRFLADASDAKVDETLTEMTQGAGRVWELLLFHEPAKVQVWLATRAWASEPTYHNGIRLTLYGLPRPPVVVREPNLAVGPALTLTKIEVADKEIHPGDMIQSATDWYVTQAAPEYKFSLRLYDEANTITLAQDYVPQNWFAPTNVWIVGQAARDQHGLLTPATLPPGAYRLTLRLYDPGTGAAVDTAEGQDILLSSIQVNP